MASITPIIATQDTEQSTSSSSPTDASCTTSALANGVDYLVRYTANIGGDNTSTVPAIRLVHGSDVLADVAAEGRGLSNHWDSCQCQGYAKVTGNGTDTLKFQFWSTDGNYCFAGAMAIVAIPLTDLTENSDYWHSGTNSATYEVSGASTSWETLRSQAFTLPDAGDYLVLMSAEGQPSNSGNSNERMRLRWLVDSTYLCPTDVGGVGNSEEWEDNVDTWDYSVATLVNLSSGSRTFKIDCASGNTASANYRRSNIWVFRKASFDQIVQTRDSTGESTTSSTYTDFDGLNTTYTPNQQEYVLVLGYVVATCSTYYSAVTELYNNSDTTEYCIDSGEYGNGYYDDLPPIVLTHCGQYSSAKAWRVRYRAAGGGTAHIGHGTSGSGSIESNLIFWGLTTASGGTTQNMSATMASTTGIAANISITRGLSGTLASTTGLAAALGVKRSLSATLATVTSLAAAIDIVRGLSATLQTQTDLTADVKITRGLSATLDSTTDIQAALGIIASLSATLSSTTDVIAALGVKRPMSATLETVTDITAAMRLVKTLSATLSTQTSISGNVSITRGLSATLATETEITAAMGVLRSLSATLATTTDASAALGVIRGMSATLSTVTDIIADLTVSQAIVYMSAVMQTLTGGSANLHITRGLSGTLATQTGISAALGAKRGLSATLSTTTGITANMLNLVRMAATLASQTGITADMRMIRGLAATLAMQSAIDANLTMTKGMSATLELITAINASLGDTGIVAPLPDVYMGKLILPDKRRTLKVSDSSKTLFLQDKVRTWKRK